MNAEQTIKDVSKARLEELYKDNLSDEIIERYTKEIEFITSNDNTDIYMLAYLISKKAQSHNEIILLRGTTSSSLVAYLLGISYINPIQYNIPFINIKPKFEMEVSTQYLSIIKQYMAQLGELRGISITDNNKIAILQDMKLITGIDYNSIDINSQVLEFIRDGNIKYNEFSTNNAKEIISKANPQTISDYIQVYALLHGTDVWQNNIEHLLESHCIKELPCTREDIYMKLLNNGIDKETAYKIMEIAGKGKALTDNIVWNELVTIMKKHNIEEWYIASLEKIRYSFPKAHCCTYTIINLWLAWYEINYSTEFKQITEKMKPTTYKEVMKQLEGKRLEDYTKEDVIDRYIAYGTEEELKTPQVQRLLIKHKLYSELMECTDIIEDKQVIQDLLSSDIFNNKNIYLIEGKILNIEKKILLSTLNNKDHIYYAAVIMEDKTTSKPVELKALVLLDLEDLEIYKTKLQPYYKKNIVAVIEEKEKDICISCYLQAYEDIDYTKYKKSAT